MTEGQPTAENEYLGAAEAIWRNAEVSDIAGFRVGKIYDFGYTRALKIDIEPDLVPAIASHALLVEHKYFHGLHDEGASWTIRYLLIDLEHGLVSETPDRQIRDRFEHTLIDDVASLSNEGVVALQPLQEFFDALANIAARVESIRFEQWRPGPHSPAQFLPVIAQSIDSKTSL